MLRHSDLEARPARLYQVSNSTGVIAVEEIYEFAQVNLIEDTAAVAIFSRQGLEGAVLEDGSWIHGWPPLLLDLIDE